MSWQQDVCDAQNLTLTPLQQIAKLSFIDLNIEEKDTREYFDIFTPKRGTKSAKHSKPPSLVPFASRHGNQTPEKIASSSSVNHKTFSKLHKKKKKLKKKLQEYVILDRFVKEENKRLKMQSAKLQDEIDELNLHNKKLF